MTLEVESLLPVPIHVGGGYGGDSDWGHGQWKGAGFTERVTYDMTDPAVVGRVMFGVIDTSAAPSGARRAGAAARAGGSSSTALLGLHEPSGFTDWFTLRTLTT